LKRIFVFCIANGRVGIIVLNRCPLSRVRFTHRNVWFWALAVVGIGYGSNDRDWWKAEWQLCSE